MRILSWNVNGIRAVEKRGDLAWLWDSDADIVCLQETKAHENQLLPALKAPPGWRSAWCSGKKKGYSGTATFVRERYALDVFALGLGDAELDSEGRVTATDHGSFVLWNIYFPNGGRGPERMRFKMKFYEAFAARMDELVAQGRDVVIVGDWNVAHREIDVALPERWRGISGFLPEERAWFDGLLKGGYVDTFRAEHGDRPRQYSWWDVRTDARPDNIGWRIDYVVINERIEEKLLDAWISQNVMGSDHCPVGAELDLPLRRAELATGATNPAHAAHRGHDDEAPEESVALHDEGDVVDEDDTDDAPSWSRR